MASRREEHHLRAMAFAQFRIAGVQDRAGCFSQGDVDGIVGGKVVPQFPNPAHQRCVRIALSAECRKPRENLLAPMRIDTLACNQAPESANHFHVEQVWNDEWPATTGQIASDGIGQRAVREKFEEFGLDARACAGVRIAAVGGVTAGALREWGLEPDLVPSGEQSASGLLEEWPPFDEVLDPINRVFLPRAAIATETLVAGLQDMGWEVDDVTAYRTVRAAPPAASIREAIKTGKFDAVVFTSSSTVRNLVGIAGKPHPATVVACIGPATAKIAEEHGLRVDVLAPEASAASLVDALAEYGMGLAVAAAEVGESVVRPSARRASTRRKAK